jgi:hypothetical protein
MGTGSFPEVESGGGVTLTPHPLLVPRSKNRVELYLYSPYGPSWPIKKGWNQPVAFTKSFILPYDSSLATEWATGVDGFMSPLRNKTAFKQSFDSSLKCLHSSASYGIAILPSGHLHHCRRTRNLAFCSTRKNVRVCSCTGMCRKFHCSSLDLKFCLLLWRIQVANWIILPALLDQMWTLVTLGSVTGIKGPSERSAWGKVNSQFEGGLEAGNSSACGTSFDQDGVLQYCIISHLLFCEWPLAFVKQK